MQARRRLFRRPWGAIDVVVATSVHGVCDAESEVVGDEAGDVERGSPPLLLAAALRQVAAARRLDDVVAGLAAAMADSVIGSLAAAARGPGTRTQARTHVVAAAAEAVEDVGSGDGADWGGEGMSFGRASWAERREGYP